MKKRKQRKKHVDVASFATSFASAKGWEETLKVPDELKKAVADEQKVIRVPVKYDYAAIHPDFLKMMAEIGSYADNKYGSWSQYLNARLVGNASPVNHIFEHARSYQMHERYDHFEGDPRRHLAAIAYNAMMEFASYCKWGPAPSTYTKGFDSNPWPPPEPTVTFAQAHEVQPFTRVVSIGPPVVTRVKKKFRHRKKKR